MTVPATWTEWSRLLPWLVVIFLCTGAAVSDVRVRRIPNALTAPALLGALVWAACTRGIAGALEAVAACCAVAIPFVLLFIFAGGGAGDAKLMGAVGAWLGLRQGMVALACVLVCGGLLAVLFAVAGRRLLLALANVWDMVFGLALLIGRRKWSESVGMLPKTEQMQTMPYGLAVLAGVCVAAGGMLIWQ